MKEHHLHHEHGSCVGRRGLLSVALLAAALMILPLGGRALAQEADEIVIGGTISQSGPFQGIASPFEPLARAWAERINARGGIPMEDLGKSLPIRFVFYDDQSDPAVALRFYERLATVDEVDVFIGPFTSFITNAALQAAATHKIPMFMAEATDPVLLEERHPWATAGFASAREEHAKIPDLLDAVGGVRKVAALSRDNLHENESMDGLAEGLRDAGYEIVFQEIAPKEIKDFSSIVLRMRQAEPDLVIVESIPPPWTIGFLKQARSLGLNPKDIFLGHAPVPVIKSMGESAENILSVLWSYEGDTADHREFFALCEEVGIEWWQFSEAGSRYLTFRRIEDALRRASSLDPEEIRQAMWDTNMTLYDGGTLIRHDNMGWSTTTQWPAQVQNGKYVSLWPPEVAEQRFRHKNGQW